MGRKRVHDTGLPERVMHWHGSYFYRRIDGKKLNLGRDFQTAMMRWAELLPQTTKISTLADLIEAYTLNVLPKKAERTQQDYRIILKNLRAMFGHMTPKNITAPVLQEYVERRGAPRRAAYEIAVMSGVLSYGINKGVLRTNPCRYVQTAEPGVRDRYIEDWEYSAVRNVATGVVRVALDLALLTGLRQGNILKLKLADLQDDGIHVLLGKQRKGRKQKRLIIEWSPELRAVIAEARALGRNSIGSLYLLYALKGKGKGQPYTRSGFSAMWQRTMIKAIKQGVLAERFTFHDVRGKNASDEETEAKASERMGHASQAMTRRVYRRKPTRVAPLLTSVTT